MKTACRQFYEHSGGAAAHEALIKVYMYIYYLTAQNSTSCHDLPFVVVGTGVLVSVGSGDVISSVLSLIVGIPNLGDIIPGSGVGVGVGCCVGLAVGGLGVTGWGVVTGRWSWMWLQV